MLSGMGDDIANRHLGWIAIWAFIGLVVLGIGIALANVAPKPHLGWLWWLVGLCGIILIFSIFAASSPFTGSCPFRDKRPATAVLPSPNLSTLDQLTPLDTPIRPPSLSDHFKDPYTKGEPDYSTVPTDPSKLQKKNPFPDPVYPSPILDYPDIPEDPRSIVEQALDAANSWSRPVRPRAHSQIPDFGNEWAERDRLLQRCAGAVEEPEAVWAWVQKVYEKILQWSPKRALEFRPDPSPVTKYPDNRLISPVTASLLMKGYEFNYSRQNLTMYGERLAMILDEESG
jgi:hypothetical protein